MLLRILLRLVGIRVGSNRGFSEVTKTIEALPVLKSRRWFYGGLLHTIPVIIGLAVMISLRGGSMTASVYSIAALFVAASWSFVGPALIWTYERYTLPRFNADCRRLLLLETDRKKLQEAVYRSMMSEWLYRTIAALWIGVVIYAYLTSAKFITTFGVYGFTDWLYWVLFAGVILYAYYGSLGLCFAVKSLILIGIVSRAKINERIYHADRTLGFSVVENYVFATNMFLFSGWLFAPLLLVADLPSGTSDALIIDYRYVLVVLYASFSFGIFCFPVYMIHNKLVRIKSDLSRASGNRTSSAFQQQNDESTPHNIRNFEFERLKYLDVQRIKTWPMSLDTFTRVFLSTIMFPLIVGIVVAWWGTNRLV